jgi:hypothetical protein
MGYTVGRFWIEALRKDPANHILGMRVNSWMSILVFLAALAWFVRHGGSERSSAVSAAPSVGQDDESDAAELGNPASEPARTAALDSEHANPSGSDESAEPTGDATPSDR